MASSADKATFDRTVYGNAGNSGGGGAGSGAGVGMGSPGQIMARMGRPARPAKRNTGRGARPAKRGARSTRR